MKPIEKLHKPYSQYDIYNIKGRNKTMENEQKYVSVKPQDKDVFICMSNTPYKSEEKEVLCHKGTPKEKLVKITNYGLYVKKDMESETFWLTITKQMYQNLIDCDEIKDKKIIFGNYEHKTYGTLLSVRLLK